VDPPQIPLHCAAGGQSHLPNVRELPDAWTRQLFEPNLLSIPSFFYLQIEARMMLPSKSLCLGLMIFKGITTPLAICGVQLVLLLRSAAIDALLQVNMLNDPE
jgi:hypothetical protein